MIIIQIIYWVVLIADLTDNEVLSKKEFWIKLIPLLFVIHAIFWFIEKYKNLDI